MAEDVFGGARKDWLDSRKEWLWSRKEEWLAFREPSGFVELS